MNCTLEPAIQSGDSGHRTPFLTAVRLTITYMSVRMSTITLNTDCICFGNLASTARSLQENSQSERVYYCSHIIKLCDKQQDNRKFVNEPMTIILKTSYRVSRKKTSSMEKR